MVDTEWHTVVFHAKIKSGQFGKTITNTAEVTGEGISTQTIEPMRILPSTGVQFSIAPYTGGLLLVIGLLFLVRSKNKNKNKNN
ncbi:LPXTG cell wall anchor domain-containing protein [Bacillus toyonensis]|uniref:LPXTG cell wall anchor domain-containing protein n=1 Tax=Bacillus toyonensis TaxID=155322 RepID=UPI0018D197F9|nr:LPXTG cell wall anchor domain-containing protein [Bacillus toyonensis]MBH0356860.1 hypothetical protein [Bacillus toyonensis biovar Thuringiensis]